MESVQKADTLYQSTHVGMINDTLFTRTGSDFSSSPLKKILLPFFSPTLPACPLRYEQPVWDRAIESEYAAHSSEEHLANQHAGFLINGSVAWQLDC